MPDLFAGTAFERVMPSVERRRWGRFYTAPACVDIVLRLCLRDPADRVLDPSCGTGIFVSRAAMHKQRLGTESLAPAPVSDLWGVEVEREAAAEASQNLYAQGLENRAHIVCADFLTLDAGSLPVFDCIVGNPPYTRQEWMRELAPGGDSSALTRRALGGLANLTRRAGLHAYFFVHAARFLREGGRLGFIASNSWLDVDYGTGLQAFFLNNFRIAAIVESEVERWFADASVNTCLVILERCADASARKENPVRFVQLCRPLSYWLPATSQADENSLDSGYAAALDELAGRILSEDQAQDCDLQVRSFYQDELGAHRPVFGGASSGSPPIQTKWGLLLRAPDVYLDALDRNRSRLVPLRSLARIRRGCTAGANEFFYLSRAAAEKWQIEPQFLRPLLKSPRDCAHPMVDPAALPNVAIVVRGNLADQKLVGTRAGDYIRWGESRGFHLRPTCAARRHWYEIGESPPAQLAWIKGVWARHFSPVLPPEPIVLDQQLYGIELFEPASSKVTAALLNSTWIALCAELGGRVNFGEGILWIAAYEAGHLLLPDPASMSDAQASDLACAFDALCLRPVLPIDEQMLQPDRYRLDEIVFDILELSEAERRSIRVAVENMARARRTKAVSRKKEQA